MNFFKFHYDDEFFEDSYMLFRKEINNILKKKKVITLSTVKDYCPTEKNVIDLSSTEPGLINHYSEQGNRVVYDTIISKL